MWRKREKREALGKAAETEIQKYVQDAFPIVRDKAVQLAPQQCARPTVDRAQPT